MQFELKNFIPYKLSLLTNTVSQGIAGAYSQSHDISVTEWRILAVLGRFPGLTASEITAQTAMDKVAISRAVKSLVAKNLLQRETAHEDRRCRRLYITPDKGQEVLQQVVPKALDYEKALLNALDPKEAKVFITTLNKLQQKASQLQSPK